MNKLEAYALFARFMGASVEQHYPFNLDYKQDGLLFSFRPTTVDGKHVETSPHPLFRNFSSASVKYGESYDWLMPVVKKLAKEDFPTLTLLEAMGELLKGSDLSCETLFDAVAKRLKETRPELFVEHAEAK